MIPISLTLRNFLSYGAEDQTLDFRGHHILCLSGENGHGKSAVLDAMTWSLFGRSRAATDDELLHLGASDMQVVFDLALNGVPHRVSRLRYSKGKTRLTQLELFVAEPTGAWRPLTGNSVGETERSIEQLLGMSYRTFINSAFLLQGRADEFTTKQPAERKKVLADVLNLDAYERLATRAKERRQQWAAAREQAEQAIADLDLALQRLPAARETLEQARLQAAAAQAALAPAKECLARLQSAWQEVLRLRQEQETIQQQHGRISAQLREQGCTVAALEARQAQALAVLTAREQVEQRYAAWLAQQARVAEQGRRLLRLQPLQERRQKLQRAIDQAERHLGQEAAELRGKLQGCIQESAKGIEAELVLDTLLTEIEAVEQAPEQRRQVVQRQSDLREQIAALRADERNWQLQLTQLRARYQTLGDGETPCPTCDQPLSTGQRQTLRASMQEEAERCKSNQHQMKDLVAEQERTLQALTRELGALEGKVKQLEQLRLTEAALREKVHLAECAQQQAQQWQQALALLQARLEKKQFALDERQQLAAVEEEYAAVGYDQAAHQQALQQAQELASAETAKHELDRAAQSLRGLEETLEQARQSLASWEAQRLAFACQLRAIDDKLAGHTALEDELRLEEATVRRLEDEQRLAEAAVVRAEQDIEQLEGQQRAREQRLVALKEAQFQQGMYADLMEAFGRNGAQAMLIDEAIPLITDEANELLRTMGAGQLTVSLETHRLTQKQQTVETLDVRISDELGTRNYELYSGGEAFRVNFALRVALSRVLAHRAGTRLQTLVIDEGFGSQDANGREGLRSALEAVAKDFACIIVITHLDEMKEFFPSRVEVVKDAAGSHFRLIAA